MVRGSSADQRSANRRLSASFIARGRTQITPRDRMPRFQIVFRAHDLRAFHQRGENRKFTTRQVDRDVVRGRGEGGQVKDNSVVGEMRRGASGLAPGDSTHPCCKFVEVEWFTEIIVRAGVQPLDPVANLIERGEQQYGSFISGSSNVRKYVEA